MSGKSTEAGPRCGPDLHGKATNTWPDNRWNYAVPLVLFLLLSAQAVRGQGTFRNLGFEQSAPPSQQSPWVDFGGWFPDRVVSGYNTISLGGPGVILHDSNSSFAQPLLGNYSVQLVNAFFPLPPGEISIAAIMQTGTIPSGSRSIRFIATSLAPVVSFGGNPMAVQRIGTSARFNLFAGDVTAFTGQLGDLRFSQTGMLDEIWFSTLPVPEPDVELLLLAGVTLVLARARSRR